eukprot:893154-Karenia_brevis.AAC.1
MFLHSPSAALLRQWGGIGTCKTRSRLNLARNRLGGNIGLNALDGLTCCATAKVSGRCRHHAP